MGYASACACAQTGPPFAFSLDRGPYAVGLKVVEQYDPSRSYSGSGPRPMQTLVWYPASTSKKEPMTVRDYSELWATEAGFDHPRMSDAARKWLLGMAPVLKDRLWAVRDASRVRGNFPVVIYSPSLASVPTPWENADLCEYIASHGYVVLASPNLGMSTSDMVEDLSGIEVQARDISFLIDYARTLSDTDRSRATVVGFSWGGIASLFAAARDDRIAALVALDGSMRYYPGLVRQAVDIHPEQMTIPLLYFQQANMSIEDEEKYVSEADRLGPSVLNAWTHGDLITVRMLGFTHQEFGSMYQRNENSWKIFFDPSAEGHRQGDYDRADGIVGYAWVARYTLAFLQAYVKHDAAEMNFLRNPPAQNGVPKHVLWVSYQNHKMSVARETETPAADHK